MKERSIATRNTMSAESLHEAVKETKEQSAAKKSYTVPRLVVYGDVRVITANKRKAGSDGAPGADNMST